MDASPDQFEVTAILCDAAQVAGGKLFVLGGGWDRVFNPAIPVTYALALLISVPWNRTNERHHVRTALLTEDGRPVSLAQGQPPVLAEGDFEVGRPPGVKAGSKLTVPLAIPFGMFPLPAGGYRFEIWVDGLLLKSLPFMVGGMAPSFPGFPSA